VLEKDRVRRVSVVLGDTRVTPSAVVAVRPAPTIPAPADVAVVPLQHDVLWFAEAVEG